MPLVKIKSLPFAQEVNIPQVLNVLTQALSEASKIELRHVMATWDYLTPHHYAHGGKHVETQPECTHPILVHFIAPNFNSEDEIAAMLELIASTLAEQLPVDKRNVFINYSPAYSDGVFDEGHIVAW